MFFLQISAMSLEVNVNALVGMAELQLCGWTKQS